MSAEQLLPFGELGAELSTCLRMFSADIVTLVGRYLLNNVATLGAQPLLVCEVGSRHETRVSFPPSPLVCCAPNDVVWMVMAYSAVLFEPSTGFSQLREVALQHPVSNLAFFGDRVFVCQSLTTDEPVAQLDADGKRVSTWPLRPLPGTAAEEKHIAYPTAIAIAQSQSSQSQAHAYVCEGKRVKVFSMSGELLRSFGGEHLISAVSIVINEREHEVFVADFTGARVQVFSQDGAFLRSITVTHAEHTQTPTLAEDPKQKQDKPATAAAKFGPRGMCFDRANNLIVADSLRHRVVVFSPSGQQLTEFASQEPPNLYKQRGRGSPQYPNSVCVTAEGLVVVDKEPELMRVFAFPW